MEREVTLHGVKWRTKPLDKGDFLTYSDPRRWSIIEGNDHFTLLDHGAAVARLASAAQCIEEAIRRMAGGR